MWFAVIATLLGMVALFLIALVVFVCWIFFGEDNFLDGTLFDDSSDE